MKPASPFRRAKITHLDTPYRNSLHAYQGLCPWNPQGSSLLYLGFDGPEKMADVVIRDLRSGQDTVAATSASFNYHTGVYQQWILHGQGFVYQDGKAHDRRCVVVPVPGASWSPAFYPDMHVRSVSANSERGYGTFAKSGSIDAAAARLDFATGAIQTMFTAEEASRHLPRDLAEDCCFAVNHFVPNRDESLAFFKLCKPAPHRRIPGEMEEWGAFFIFNFHSGDFRCLGKRVSGHPQWMPDGRHVVNIMQPLDGSDNRWIVTQDSHTGEVERLVDFPIEGAGHPVISPCGRFLATDAYTAKRQICPVYVIDLQTGQMAEIARLAHSTLDSDTYQPHTISRSNLHPVWSPDGKQLLVNVNGGSEYLEMILLEDFLN